MSMTCVPDEWILKCRHFTEVLNLSVRVSGRALKEIAWDCGWGDDGKVLRAILNTNATGDKVRHMPGDKLALFMRACNTDAPLRWQELRLRALLEDQAGPHVEDQPESGGQEFSEIRRMLEEILRAVNADRPRYSLVRGERVRRPGLWPAWLMAAVKRVRGIHGDRYGRGRNE